MLPRDFPAIDFCLVLVSRHGDLERTDVITRLAGDVTRSETVRSDTRDFHVLTFRIGIKDILADRLRISTARSLNRFIIPGTLGRVREIERGRCDLSRSNVVFHVFVEVTR